MWYFRSCNQELNLYEDVEVETQLCKSKNIKNNFFSKNKWKVKTHTNYTIFYKSSVSHKDVFHVSLSLRITWFKELKTILFVE